MATFKSSNDLVVKVSYGPGGLLVARAYRGDTEIQIKTMEQHDRGLNFTAALDQEVPAPAPVIEPDVAAANALSDTEKDKRHSAAIKAEALAKAEAEAAEKAAKDAAEAQAAEAEKGKDKDAGSK